MDYAAARRAMVENQVRTNRVTDPLVIAALNELPREAFVPEALRGIAYVDEDIPIGGGRYLLEPLTAALLLQTAEINIGDLVLVVGAGTGYEAAAAARVAGAVVALESDPKLAAGAREVLAELGIATVSVIEGPLAAGCAKQAPYDVILFAGAVAEVPEAILAQLAEGGRLVSIVHDAHRLGRGTLFLKAGGVVSRRIVFDAASPLLPDFVPVTGFRF